MSVLNVDGILFSDATQLDSKYDIIEQNSVTVFFEASAPTGWTKLTTHNNKALRVVSGTGGGFGSGGTSGPGGSPFTTIFNPSIPLSGTVPISGTVGGHTLIESELPSHAHGAGAQTFVRPGPGVSVRAAQDSTPNTSSVGGNQPHTHPFTGAQVPWTASVDLAVQYIDVILCRFN